MHTVLTVVIVDNLVNVYGQESSCTTTDMMLWHFVRCTFSFLRPCHYTAKNSNPDQSLWVVWWTKWHLNRVLLKSFCFPGHCHSTTAPYSFIHLLLTLSHGSLKSTLQLPSWCS